MLAWRTMIKYTMTPTQIPITDWKHYLKQLVRSNNFSFLAANHRWLKFRYFLNLAHENNVPVIRNATIALDEAAQALNRMRNESGPRDRRYVKICQLISPLTCIQARCWSCNIASLKHFKRQKIPHPNSFVSSISVIFVSRPLLTCHWTKNEYPNKLT